MLRLLVKIFTHSRFSFNLCLRENETFEDDEEPSRTTGGCGVQSDCNTESECGMTERAIQFADSRIPI